MESNRLRIIKKSCHILTSFTPVLRVEMQQKLPFVISLTLAIQLSGFDLFSIFFLNPLDGQFGLFGHWTYLKELYQVVQFV